MRTLCLFILMQTLFALCAVAQKKVLLQPYQSQKSKASIKEFLEEVRSNSGIILEYSANNIEEDKIIQLDGTEQTVGAVLQKVLISQRIRLLEKNGKIILVPSAEKVLPKTSPNSHVVYGFITISGSREPLIDASVSAPSISTSSLTNPYGYFNITLPTGHHTLHFSYPGFQPQAVELEIHAAMRKDVALTLQESAAPVVIVSALQKDGAETILPGQSAGLNYFLGENDPVRSAYLIPGVKNIPESFNGMLVRGGGSNENLFLLDGNPVYNPTHMLGAISIVNPTSLKTMRLYKSDFPARFDGATSSVIDVYTKDGDMNRWHGETNIGFLAGSFSLEGPVSKGKTALMTSFRHSWPTPFLKFFQKGLQPDFYDVHFRLTHLLSKKNKFSVNFYRGKDKLIQEKKHIDNLHQWGNILGSLAWNRVLGAKSFMSTSVNMSGYNNLGAFQYTLFNGDAGEGEVLLTKSLATFSSIKHYNAKSQAQIHLSNAVKLTMGSRLSHIILKPFETRITTGLIKDRTKFTSFLPLSFNEISAYGEGEIKIGKRLFIRPGLHASVYQKNNYRFFSPQPRFFTSFLIARGHQLFASYNKMTQYLHLVTNPYLGANSDIWVPSTNLLQPEQSVSYNAGYTYKSNRQLRFSIDGYRKKMFNVTNYAEGKSYFINSRNWQQNIETGSGESYGIESLFEKNSERLSMHAGYTLAWSFRKFSSINGGQKFPYKYDRRHDINLGISCKFKNKITASALWSFATGDMFSLPDQIYPDFDMAQQVQTPDDVLKDYRFIYHFSGVNQYRTAPYQRLNIAVNYHTKTGGKIHSALTAGIYSVYGAPDQYSYELKGSLRTKRIVIETKNQTFNITPYVSYTLKFSRYEKQ